MSILSRFEAAKVRLFNTSKQVSSNINTNYIRIIFGRRWVKFKLIVIVFAVLVWCRIKIGIIEFWRLYGL